METTFEHVVIVGCGLLGASLGMALRQRRLAKTVTGVGRAGSNSLEVARQRGAIDRAADLAHAAAGADLVVLCVPVRQFPPLLRELADVLERGAIVTDVGSTKAQVMQWGAELLPAHVDFVGSHPMAGSEKSGPEAARENLYEKALCLVCRPAPPRTVSEAGFQKVLGLWRGVGMRPVACDAAEHDRRVAAISHLPHAVASSLVLAAADLDALEIAAGGFADTTRVASGDVAMWTDILLTNPAGVGAAIAQFQGRLSMLKDAVERGDEQAIRNFLSASRSTRDAFMAQRAGGK